jgi:putative membrane protein
MMYGRGLELGYGMMGGGWFGAVMMLVFGLLVIAGIVLLVVWAVRTSHLAHSGTSVGSRRSAPESDEAVAVCRRRFASGEITKEQYDEIMGALDR